MLGCATSPLQVGQLDSKRLHLIGDWRGLLLVLTATQALLIAADPVIRFFLGDSASYLHAATHDWIPPDRSYLYPLGIRWLVAPFHSLFPLLLLQSVATVGIAMMGFQIMRRALTINVRIAMPVALLMGLGPELVFYSRMVMAEISGMLALVSMLAVGCAYLRRSNPIWLPMLALLSLVAVSLRLSLLPVAMGMAMLPPLLITLVRRRAERFRWLRGILHLALLVCSMYFVHSEYKSWYRATTGSTANDYVQEGGYFRLGLVLPMVRAVDLHGLGLPENFLGRFPTASDPDMREAQLWLPDGIVAGIKDELGNDRGNRAARKIAGRAIRRDPLGLIRLGVMTEVGYFEPATAKARMLDDSGVVPIDDDFATFLHDVFHYDGRDVHVEQSFARSAFVGSRLWLTFCLFALIPMAAFAIVVNWSTPARTSTLYVSFSAMGLATSHILFSHIPSFRYLLPFPFFAWLCIAIIISAMVQRRRTSRDRNQGGAGQRRLQPTGAAFESPQTLLLAVGANVPTTKAILPSRSR